MIDARTAIEHVRLHADEARAENKGTTTDCEIATRMVASIAETMLDAIPTIAGMAGILATLLLLIDQEKVSAPDAVKDMGNLLLELEKYLKPASEGNAYFLFVKGLEPLHVTMPAKEEMH